MRNAAIYVRISSDPTNGRLGVLRQLEDCRKLASDRDLSVSEAHIYEDNDVSATYQKRRPQFEALKAAVASAAIDCVIVWHADRLYRHPRELEDLIDFVERYKLTILQVTAGDIDLSTSQGQIIARIVGAIAKGEVAQKADRHARKHLQLAQQGRSHGGRRPLGYEPDRVTIRESEASLLREAARKLIEGEESLNAVCRWLTTVWPWHTHDTRRDLHGDLSPSPRPMTRVDRQGREVDNRVFKPRVLRDALTTPHIAGKRIHLSVERRRRYRTELQEYETAGALGQHQKPPDEPKPEIYQAVWDAVLDEQTWLSLCNHFDSVYSSSPRRDLGAVRPRTALPRRGRPARSPLGGVLKCGQTNADGSMCASNLGASGVAYKCPPSVTGGCASVSISRTVERAIWNIIGSDSELPLRCLLRSMFSAYYNTADKDDSTREELVKLNEKRARLANLNLEGDIVGERYYELRDEIDVEIAAVEAALATADRYTLEARQVLGMVQILQPTNAKETERFLLTKLIDQIIVAPSTRGKRAGRGVDLGRLTIHWSTLSGKSERIQRFEPDTRSPEVKFSFHPLMELAIAAREVGLISSTHKVDPALKVLLDQAPAHWRAAPEFAFADSPDSRSSSSR